MVREWGLRVCEKEVLICELVELLVAIMFFLVP